MTCTAWDFSSVNCIAVCQNLKPEITVTYSMVQYATPPRCQSTQANYLILFNLNVRVREKIYSWSHIVCTVPLWTKMLLKSRKHSWGLWHSKITLDFNLKLCSDLWRLMESNMVDRRHVFCCCRKKERYKSCHHYKTYMVN